jgi:hypothetical protein
MCNHYDIALSFATENQELVEKVYYYLKAEKVNAFFAPSLEAQIFLSGKNQSEAFYNIFGMEADYVALFVSKDYINKPTPMEEAGIAFGKHGNDGTVIPIYIDETSLPADLFNPKKTNYFKSNNPVEIANHLVAKVKVGNYSDEARSTHEQTGSVMNIQGNKAKKQLFVNKIEGEIRL